MSGTRYLKELDDRAVVTWTLTEPYAGIQDWTWKPTVNRFQAVLHTDGVIDLTYDDGLRSRRHRRHLPQGAGRGREAARDALPPTRKPPRRSKSNPSSSPHSTASISRRRSKPARRFPHRMTPSAADTRVYRTLSQRDQTPRPCANNTPGATVWTAQRFRAFRQRPAATGRGARYIGFGNGLSPDVTVEGSTITLKGTLPVGIQSGSQLYVSASAEASGRRSSTTSQATHVPAQTVRLEGIGSPEMHLATIKKQDGPFPIHLRKLLLSRSPRAPTTSPARSSRRSATSSICSPTTPTFASTILKPARRALAR